MLKILLALKQYFSTESSRAGELWEYGGAKKGKTHFRKNVSTRKQEINNEAETLGRPPLFYLNKGTNKKAF